MNHRLQQLHRAVRIVLNEPRLGQQQLGHGVGWIEFVQPVDNQVDRIEVKSTQGDLA